MLINFFSVLALVFVLEGIMPFVFPARWKRLFRNILEQDEKVLRFAGLFSMLVGVILLTIVHQFVE